MLFSGALVAISRRIGCSIIPSSERRSDSSDGSASTTGTSASHASGSGSAGGGGSEGGGLGGSARPSGAADNSFVFFVISGSRVHAGSSNPVCLALRCSRKARTARRARHAGTALVADRRGQRRRVIGHLQVGAVAAVLAARRDVGQHLGLEPVGADLLPHRDGDGVDQLPLGGVDRAVALLQVQHVLGPLLRVLLGQQHEVAGAQAVLQRVPGRARLALGRLRAALLRGGGGRSGMAVDPGQWRAARRIA